MYIPETRNYQFNTSSDYIRLPMNFKSRVEEIALISSWRAHVSREGGAKLQLLSTNSGAESFFFLFSSPSHRENLGQERSVVCGPGKKSLNGLIMTGPHNTAAVAPLANFAVYG